MITDLEEFVPLMQLNIDANKHLLPGNVRAEALCWGTPTNGQFSFPDYLLLSDCIYYEAVCISWCKNMRKCFLSFGGFLHEFT